MGRSGKKVSAGEILLEDILMMKCVGRITTVRYSKPPLSSGSRRLPLRSGRILLRTTVNYPGLVAFCVFHMDSRGVISRIPNMVSFEYHTFAELVPLERLPLIGARSPNTGGEVGGVDGRAAAADRGCDRVYVLVVFEHIVSR